MPEASVKKNREPAQSGLHAGARALVRAVETGDAAEVSRLISAGAAADVPLAGGETMLMRATAKGHTDVVRVLLDGGAEINARRNDGFTPLIVAAFYGHAEVVRLLLDHGAHASARTRLGSAAEGWAASHGFNEVVGLLKHAAPAGAKTLAPGEVVAADRTPFPISPASWADAGDEGEVKTDARQREAAPPHDELTINSHELAVNPPVELRAMWSRYRGAWAFALALIVVSGVALYAFVWRAKSPTSSQPPSATTGNASNVTALPAPLTGETAPNAQPTPITAPTPEVLGVPQGASNNIPTVIILPSDAPPAGPNAAAGQSNVPSTSAPGVVSEGGARASEVKTPTRGAANSTDEQTVSTGDGQGGNARPDDDAARATQGQGGEIRTVAPVRPSSPPTSTLVTQPSPTPTPRRKVIQWP